MKKSKRKRHGLDKGDPADSKGLENLMNDLYEEQMAKNAWEDYENIRNPRREEPGLLLKFPQVWSFSF